MVPGSGLSSLILFYELLKKIVAVCSVTWMEKPEQMTVTVGTLLLMISVEVLARVMVAAGDL